MILRPIIAVFKGASIDDVEVVFPIKSYGFGGGQILDYHISLRLKPTDEIVPDSFGTCDR